MIHEIDAELLKVLTNYGKYLVQNGYLKEGLNCERLAVNYISKKEVCNVNVGQRPKLVKQLSIIDQKLESLSQLSDMLLQEREDIVAKLCKTEVGFIDKIEKEEKEL